MDEHGELGVEDLLGGGGPQVPSRHEEPEEWERLVASEDTAITTRLKDGMWPVSFSSAPSVMARMIDALFDRVIVTAAVHTVPYAWVEQTRDGGLIVTPYTGAGHRAALVVLTVDGGVATGGVVGDAAFMPLSGQGLRQADLHAIESRPGLRLQVTASGQRLTA